MFGVSTKRGGVGRNGLRLVCAKGELVYEGGFEVWQSDAKQSDGGDARRLVQKHVDGGSPRSNDVSKAPEKAKKKTARRLPQSRSSTPKEWENPRRKSALRVTRKRVQTGSRANQGGISPAHI